MIYVLGGESLFAIIGVSYPAGSTCTCTKGTKVLKAKDTSGTWIFNVPEIGKWTVSCTNGSSTKSQVVNITAKGQYKTVTLKYELWLYNLGNEFTSVTGGWTGSLQKNTTYLYGDGGWNYSSGSTTKIIDFTGYTTLKIHVISATSYTGWGYPPALRIVNASNKQIFSKDLTGATAGSKSVSNVTQSYDVSDLQNTSITTPQGKVWLNAFGGGDGWGGYLWSDFKVDKIWFTP